MELRKLDRKLAQAIFEFKLIDDGDTVLIALSGGKDSLALVELLSRRSKIFKPHFSLVAAHISMENLPYQSDIDYLRYFCESHGVPFVHEQTRFDLQAAKPNKEKSTCFLCSWTRRKKLFEIAEAHGCKKIALGHHQDDILQTLLMNQIFQGAFSTMPPKLKMDKFDMTIIRPLATIQEKDLVELAQLHGYHKQIKHCPYECESNRAQVKHLLDLMEQLNPYAKQSLWGSMRNIQSQYLPE